MSGTAASIRSAAPLGLSLQSSPVFSMLAASRRTCYPATLRHRDVATLAGSKEGAMEIDRTQIGAAGRGGFDRYEKALVSNDVPVLDELFHDDPRTIRYGAGEILYGHSAITSLRSARSPAELGRKLSRTVITTFGREFAVASTLYERPSATGKIGRQMQTWVKFPEGARVCAAHGSRMDNPA